MKGSSRKVCLDIRVLYLMLDLSYRMQCMVLCAINSGWAGPFGHGGKQRGHTWRARTTRIVVQLQLDRIKPHRKGDICTVVRRDAARYRFEWYHTMYIVLNLSWSDAGSVGRVGMVRSQALAYHFHAGRTSQYTWVVGQQGTHQPL
jgi:hypothetical protein